MPEDECFICYQRDKQCKEKDGYMLSHKGRKSLQNAANQRKDLLFQDALSNTTKSAWIAKKCYLDYTHPRNIKKALDKGAEKDDDQQNQSFETRSRSSPFCYKTHCLICARELNFQMTKKKQVLANGK